MGDRGKLAARVISLAKRDPGASFILAASVGGMSRAWGCKNEYYWFKNEDCAANSESLELVLTHLGCGIDRGAIRYTDRSAP